TASHRLGLIYIDRVLENYYTVTIMTAAEVWKKAQSLIEQRSLRSSERFAKELVDYLNYVDGHEAGDDNRLLRCFVETWIKCGYDAGLWSERARFNSLLGALRYNLEWVDGGPPGFHTDGHLSLRSSNLVPDEEYDRYLAGRATKVFLRFVTSPWFDKIADC